MIAIILVWSATLFCVAVVAYAVVRAVWTRVTKKIDKEINEPWRDIR